MLESKKTIDKNLNICLITNDAHEGHRRSNGKSIEVCKEYLNKLNYDISSLDRQDSYPIKLTNIVRFKDNYTRREVLFCLIALKDLIESEGVLKANDFEYFDMTNECYSLLDQSHLDFLKRIRPKMRVANSDK